VRAGSVAAAAAALAALLAAPAGARAGPCALGLAADPPWLDLGEAGTARLRVRGAAAPPRLSASAGRIADLQPDGDGYVATFVPPPEPWPQLALVVAFDGERHGVLAIPLYGHGVAQVETRPGTDVSVTIGDRTFGPVRTGADGRAAVPVLVAPGVTEARRGRQVIPLRPPPLRRVHLSAALPSVRADRGEDLLLVAAVAAEDGAPWDGPPPAVEVAEGELWPAGSCGPGAFAWRWRLAPGPIRTATASARLGDLPPSEVALAVVAGPASRIALVPAAAAAPAGGAVDLLVRAVDAAGNPADGMPAVSATPGAVGAAERSGPGEWRARYVAPERLDGARLATLRAALDAAAAEATLALDAAGPGEARLEPAPPVRRLGVQVRAGAAVRRGSGVAPEAGLEVTAWPARLGGWLGVAVEGGASSLSRTATLSDGATSARVTGEATLLTAGLSLAGALRRGDLSLWLTAGPGLAFVSTHLSLQGAGHDAGSRTVPEAHAALALGVATRRGTPFAVLRLGWIGDLDGTAFSGPLRTASLGVGWRLDAL
jgi:hypothetical protein